MRPTQLEILAGHPIHAPALWQQQPIQDAADPRGPRVRSSAGDRAWADTQYPAAWHQLQLRGAVWPREPLGVRSSDAPVLDPRAPSSVASLVAAPQHALEQHMQHVHPIHHDRRCPPDTRIGPSGPEAHDPTVRAWQAGAGATRMARDFAALAGSVDSSHKQGARGVAAWPFVGQPMQSSPLSPPGPAGTHMQAGGGVFGDLVAATQIAPPPDAGHMVAAGPDSHHSPPHPMLGFGASPEHASGDFGAAASQNRDVQYLFHIVDPSLPKRRRGVPGPPRPPQLAGTLATAPSIESSLPLYSGSSSIDSGIGTAAGASSGGSASMLSSLQHLSMDLRKHPRAQPVNYHRRGDPRYKFECELCGRVFRRKLGLTSHMPMHTGERIYRCNLCDQRFSRKHDMQRHHKTHDKANQQKCHYCQRMFQRKDALDRHLKSTTNRGCSMELRRSIGEADQSSPASAGIM